MHVYVYASVRSFVRLRTCARVCRLEEAKIFWERSEYSVALQLVNTALMHIGTPQTAEQKLKCARMLHKQGQWLLASRTEQKSVVDEVLSCALTYTKEARTGDVGKAHFAMAEFLDKIHTEMEAQMDTYKYRKPSIPCYDDGAFGVDGCLMKGQAQCGAIVVAAHCAFGHVVHVCVRTCTSVRPCVCVCTRQ